MGRRGQKFISLGVIALIAVFFTSFSFIQDAETQSPTAVIKTVHPAIPSGETTFDSWIAIPELDENNIPTDKAEVVKDNDGDQSYILRVSDSKWQTYILENATDGENAVPPGATIENVTLFAVVRNDGTNDGNISVGCETGKSKNKIYQGGDELILINEPYKRIDFTFNENPATNRADKSWLSTDVDDWEFEGKQLACGVISQDRQNSAPIFVTEFGAEIFWSDIIAPVVTARIDDDITVAPDDPEFTENTSVTILGVCTDEGVGCNLVEYSFDGFATVAGQVVLTDDGPWSDSIILSSGWGNTRVDVRAFDGAGNNGTAFAEIYLNPVITLDNCPDNSNPIWGIDDVTCTFTTKNARATDKVFVDYGSPTVESSNFDYNSGSGSTTAQYSAIDSTVNPHQIQATIMQFDGTRAAFDFSGNTATTSSDDTNVLRHETEFRNTVVTPNPAPFNSNDALSLDPEKQSHLIIRADLVDVTLENALGLPENLAGVTSAEIVLSGDGITSLNPDSSGTGTGLITNPISGGILINDPAGLSSVNGDYLFVHEGTTFEFNSQPSCVAILIGNDAVFDYDITDGAGNTASDSIIPPLDGYNAQLSACDGNGIAEIKITGLDGTTGLTRLTSEKMGQALPIVDFLSLTESGTSINVSGGEILVEARSPNILTQGTPLAIDILFLIDDIQTPGYSGTSDSFNYETTPDALTVGGLGVSSIIDDAGIGITAFLCEPGTDTDKDGICDSFEGGNGNGIPFTANGNNYKYELPNTTVGIQDMGVEVDYMTGSQLESDVLPAIFDVFDVNGKHVEFDEQSLGIDVASTDVWINTLTGFPNRNTSFDCLKADNYGASNEQVDITQGQLVTLQNQLQKKFWRDGATYGIRVSTPADPITGGVTEGDITIRFTIDTTGTPFFPSTPTVPTLNPVTGLTLGPITTDMDQIDTNLWNAVITVHYIATQQVTNAKVGAINYSVQLTSKTTAEISDVHCSPTIRSTLLDARAQYWRYMEVVNDIGGSTGHAELNANDAIVAIGAHPNTDTQTQEVVWKSQAGTVQHELGHLLNLLHGAPAFDVNNPLISFPDADINCQVTDSGVMPYSRQVPAPLGFLSVSDWRLDYSHGTLGSINENTVPEVGGRPESNNNDLPRIAYGMPGGYASYSTARTQASTDAADHSTLGEGTDLNLNWNGNGQIANTASVATPVDTNNFGISGCQASPGQTYQDENQWDHLRFIFQDTPSGQFDGLKPSVYHNAGEVEYTQQLGQEGQISDSFILDWVSPMEDDGTIVGTGGTGGSALPIKLKVADSTGALLTIPDLVAFVSNKDASPGDLLNPPVFTEIDCGDGTNNFSFDNNQYACNWQTPKSVGVYYIKILAGHPNSNLDPNRIMTDPDFPHCVGSLELLDPSQCPILADFDPNKPELSENIEDVVSMRAEVVKKGGGNPNK